MAASLTISIRAETGRSASFTTPVSFCLGSREVTRRHGYSAKEPHGQAHPGTSGARLMTHATGVAQQKEAYQFAKRIYEPAF